MINIIFFNESPSTFKKFKLIFLVYTPTHQITNISRHYNLTNIQRELDFTEKEPSFHTNKFNLNPSFRPFIPSIFSPTNNNLKSFSFCANNLKSPTALKYPIENKFNKINDEPLDFKINLENIIMGKDRRTTLMLRNIPNKYTLQNLVDEINCLFLGKYDYINLPIDYERKLNLGYAFINFLDPLHIVSFHETFCNKKWSKYRSDKKIDLNYAEKQGKKDVNCKDENTYFVTEDKKVNFKKLSPKLELPMVRIT